MADVDLDEVEHWSDLLHQDEFWIDRAGGIHPLDDMEPRYCGNVHAFLLRQAKPYLLSSLWSMTAGPGPSGDMACDAFDAAYSELEAASERPQEWMSQRPLLVALARRADGKPARPAETTEMETEMVTPTDWNEDAPDWRTSLREGPQQYGRLTEFAEWIVSLDDIDGSGAEERRTVTLTRIIERAREALDGNK